MGKNLNDLGGNSSIDDRLEDRLEDSIDANSFKLEQMKSNLIKKICPKCEGYDLVKGDFVYKSNGNFCSLAYIDEFGKCWNYSKRKEL